MDNSNNKLMNNFDLNKNKELKYYNHQYNYKNVLSIPLILLQIYQFTEKEDIKCLSLCCKKIYQFYCNQIKKLKINEDIKESDISKIKFDKYENLFELNLSLCKNIKDFSFISKLGKLKDLDLHCTDISDISFLDKNKNIKILNLYGCKNIKDFSFIPKLEKLEDLDLHYTNISDISFLDKNKNIKILNLYRCKNIRDLSLISKSNIDLRI